MAEKPQRILIFGGTFDPPHRAHTELPALVARQLGCGRIIYIPAAQSPLKSQAPLTAAEHRLAMLALAIAEVRDAEISTIELDRGGPSYFIDTLMALRRQIGEEVDLRFLIGADQVLEFHHWKDWPDILRLAAPAIILRPPWTRHALGEAMRKEYGADEAARWLHWLVDAPLLDISATAIRRSLGQGESVEDLLDPLVIGYIRTHRLYT